MSKGTQLVCLRNPWGEAEWTGPWSDASPEWKRVMEHDLEEAHICLQNRDDGEFWMEFKDFIRYYSKVELCMIPGKINNFQN